MLPNVRRLQDAFRARGLEVIHTRIQSLTQDGRDRSPGHKRLNLHAAPGSKEAEFLEEIAPQENEIVINKTASGVFNSTNIAYILLSLAVLGIILFGVGLGLLIGTLANNEGTMQMWIGLLAVLLLFPLMLSFVNVDRLPDLARQILAWLPTTAAFELIRLSFGNTFPASLIWPKLLVLLVAVLLVFGAFGSQEFIYFQF